MNSNRPNWFSKVATVVVISGMLFEVASWIRRPGAQAQPAPQAITVGGVKITGLPDDWTHHYMAFSNPGTEDEATQNSRHDEWLRAVNDPRYILQQLKRRIPAQGPAAVAVAQVERLRLAGSADDAGIAGPPLLWQALRNPAWLLRRQNPRVLLTVGLQLAMLVVGLGLSTAFYWRRQWMPTLLLALSTAAFLLLISCGSSGTTSTDATFTDGASAGAISNDWQMDLGTSPAMSAGQYPAKYSFSTTGVGQCSNNPQPDYVIYPTGKAGSTTQANIIAYDNIYSGCPTEGGNATVPLVYWSYYTGAGTVATSPVFSGDGTKVAFIESNSSSGNSTLRILKWASGNGTDFGTPMNISSTDNNTNTYAGATANTAWSSCTTSPCMISIAFQTETNTDTTSSPWYDYSTDTLYVGDSGGYLHQFTGVFNGTPGESTNHAAPGTCGTSCVWPVAAGAGSVVTSPVFDDAHSLIFLGVGAGVGDVVSVSSTSGAIETSATIGQDTDVSVAPLVDPNAGTAGEVYVFISRTTPPRDAAVFQFAEGSISGSSGIEEVIGSQSGTIPIYVGTFDNAYYTSSTPSSPTGHIWACGDTGGDPELFAVPITGNTIGTPSGTTYTVSNTNVACSPITEFCTNSGAACSSGIDTSGSQHDYIFVSPQTQSGTPVSTCTASEGCVLSYTITTTPTAAISGAGGFAGGASGIIIDTQNTTVSGTTQLYFGILGSQACAGNGTVGSGTGGCGIQASQAAP